MNHAILVELARALSREDFVARLPEPALIVLSELSSEEASGEDDTQVGQETVGGTPGPRHTSVPARFETIAVRKKRHSADKARITVGRDRTCDLVVRTPGVSKQHAHFLPGQSLRLVDDGSQNGTFVDGRRLAAQEVAELQPGQEIVFGDLATRLVSPEELYTLLKTRRS